MVNAVLFDLDGTLVDTAPDLGYALNQQRQMHGLPEMPLELIRPYASHGTVGLLQIGFAISPDHPAFQDLRAEYLELYEQNLNLFSTLFPGMMELLDELEMRGLPWGIVTNKPARFTEPLLAQMGLDDRAATIISGDTCAHPKPHPEPMLAALPRNRRTACDMCLHRRRRTRCRSRPCFRHARTDRRIRLHRPARQPAGMGRRRLHPVTHRAARISGLLIGVQFTTLDLNFSVQAPSMQQQ